MTKTEDDDKVSNVIPLNPAKKAKDEEKVLNQKWGEETMRANYTVVPSALLKGQARLRINATELALLIHLMDHWWQADKMPWPSKKTLAERLGVGSKTIQRAMAHLEEEGLITRVARYHKTGGRTSNEYDLSPLVERLKPIAEDIVKAAEEAKQIRKKAERPGFKSRSKKKALSS